MLTPSAATAQNPPYVGLFILAGLVWWAWRRHKRYYADKAALATAIAERQPAAGTYVCRSCGTVGLPASNGPFAALVFVTVGWIPVLLFGGWSATRPARCASCKERAMIPTTSPAGRALLEKHSAKRG